MTTNDAFDPTILNWSRRYEWHYALEAIKADPELDTIHNTCCGGSEIHKVFADKLETLGRKVTHSDMCKTPTNSEFRQFHHYDILAKHWATFDCTLCISTIEDFCNLKLVVQAFENLLEQTRKRLIITCDYPGMQINWLPYMLGTKDYFLPALDNPKALHGLNSSYPQPEMADLRIILIDVEV